MAINKTEDSNDLIANCEDDEMVQYKKHSLSVVTFRIVCEENDVDSPPTNTNSFKPDMSHQVFGESEMIFGYKHLSIDLYYLHNSAKCYVDVQKGHKIVDTKGCKADNIMEALNPWLPPNYRLSKEDFLKDIAEENHEEMFGEIITTFQADSRTYKIVQCDIQNEDFKTFHQRFETFIVWFIDAASFIDLEDTRWTIFYVYDEFTHPEKKTTWRSPVGFCTVYQFFLYPNLIRPRISQFFVLPSHQKRGIGTKLYTTVHTYLRNLPNCGDITVEEPTETFQKIRDFCDSLRIYNELEESRININTQNVKQINEIMRRQKIGRRQSKRVFDILECVNSHKNGYNEYVKFTESIRARIANEIEKETRGSKRVCNSERMAVVSQPLDKKEVAKTEYKKYIDSLEWPTKRLMSHMASAPQ